MSIVDSLLVGVFGMLIVFIVLISISVLIKLISAIFGRTRGKEADLPPKEQNKAASTAVYQSRGELELIDVDEKTAALIMAIVSKNTDIPLSKLHFKSIRLLKQKG